ncbi:MAG: GNAT family N-acetyltransferase [Bacteroidales bacterium]|nr:GNAT family N-acetyltransferase [Bacteroidales bacterium]MBD5338833.1 GNAT family N-acetyltransferase [Bacteroides sp.]
MILRAIEPSDADFFYLVENDSSAWADSDTIAPLSAHMLRIYAENYDADPFASGQLRLIAAEADDPARPVGIIDLYEISPLHSHAWVGIYLLPSLRGSGRAKRMLALIADYARSHLRLSSLGARILAGNDISLKLFSDCGYILRGTLPRWRYIAGHPADLHLLTLDLTPKTY